MSLGKSGCGCLAFLIISAQLLVSCSTLQHQTDPIRPDEESLFQRAHLLWSARVERNWNQVFDLIDTKFQKNESRSGFTAKGELQEVTQYSINKATLLDINEPPLHAEVHVQFTIRKAAFEFSSVMKELWVFEPKKGWVLNKTAMKSSKPL